MTHRSQNQRTMSYVTNELPKGILYGPLRENTTAYSPTEILDKISIKRPVSGKKIDYYSFELHVINLLKNGYKEIVYPFEELESSDLIEFTVYGGTRYPIFGKDSVLSTDELTIRCKKNELDRTSIVRLFMKKSRVPKPLVRNRRGRRERSVLQLDNNE